MATRIETLYPEARFGGFTDVDGTVAFFSRVNALVGPDSLVLDVGCGRGEYAEDPVPYRRNLRILKGKAARVIGADVDPGARANPFVDEFRLIESDAWPVADSSIDVVVSDNVLEHVADPERFFDEARRVLRSGGLLCIRTTNKWSYVAVGAMLVPNRYHARVVSAVQKGRREEDVFPTVYRCNSTRQVRRAMESRGFESAVYGYAAEPSYLAFSRVAYALGHALLRVSPRFLRPAIFAFGRLGKEPA